MKTIDDLKAALSTATYRKTFSYSPDMGTPEGIQKQFDAATEFPAAITYLDMGFVEGVKGAVELITVMVDNDGTIIGRQSENKVYVARF